MGLIADINVITVRGHDGTMKRVLIINGSPRRNGSDSAICKAAADIAKRHGYVPETVFVDDLSIRGCQACSACKRTGYCIQTDCMNDMIARIKDSYMLILAMPVYFGAESAQMKTFTDRLYPIIRELGTIPDMGELRKATVIVTCGAPEGHMSYDGIVDRYRHVLGCMGISDTTGTVIYGADPATVMEKQSVIELLDIMECQLRA